ncbi:unnamed protein product [Amoebophrya sp. A25]|nr:unnamed protein product [Amoebophrya sp. A25]|eukprot:GSA25T00000617001.1
MTPSTAITVRSVKDARKRLAAARGNRRERIEVAKAAAGSLSEQSPDKLIAFLFEDYLANEPILQQEARREANGNHGSNSNVPALLFPVDEYEAVMRALVENSGESVWDAMLEQFVLSHLDLLNYFLALLGTVFRNQRDFNVSCYFELLRKCGAYLMGEGLLETTAVEGEEDLPLFFPDLPKKNFKIKRLFTKTWFDFLKVFQPEKCSALQRPPKNTAVLYSSKNKDHNSSKATPGGTMSSSSGASSTTQSPTNAANATASASATMLASTSSNNDNGEATTSSGRVITEKQLALVIQARVDRLKKSVLLHVTHIFPYLDAPMLLGDFFLQEFDRGSLEIQICALSGLLYMTTQTKLEFQDDYYDRLYLLLRPEVFSAEFRVRFQRILAASLIQGTTLPAQSAACFAKKLLRICVHAPLIDQPSICWCLGLAYNIVRKNEACCKKLLHRSVMNAGGGGSSTAGATPSTASSSKDQSSTSTTSTSTTTTPPTSGEQNDSSTTLVEGATSSTKTSPSSTESTSSVAFLTADPFDISATLPEARKILTRTSLWELEAISRHHHPLVSRVVPFFKNPHMFKKLSPSVDVNEFLELTTDDLLERELKHKKKKFDDPLLGMGFFQDAEREEEQREEDEEDDSEEEEEEGTEEVDAEGGEEEKKRAKPSSRPATSKNTVGRPSPDAQLPSFAFLPRPRQERLETSYLALEEDLKRRRLEV